MSPGSTTESYPAFARIGLRKTPEKTSTRNDRLHKRGGGVCAYIRNDLKPKVLLKSQGDASHPEYIFVEIQARLQKCLVAFCPKAVPKFIAYRDLKHVHDEQLISDAMELPWHTIFNLVTVDEKLTAFNNMVMQLFDKHAPLRKRRATHRPAPWMTDNIRNLMASRDAAYRKYRHNKSEENFYNYKKIRNRTTQNIRNAKRRHALSLVDPSISPQYLWKHLRDMGIGSKTTETEIPNISLDKLNQYFTSPPTSQPSKQQKLNTMNTLLAIPFPAREKFFFSNITDTEVRQALKNSRSYLHKQRSTSAFSKAFFCLFTFVLSERKSCVYRSPNQREEDRFQDLVFRSCGVTVSASSRETRWPGFDSRSGMTAAGGRMPRPCGTHASGKEAEDVQGKGGRMLSGERLSAVNENSEGQAGMEKTGRNYEHYVNCV
ncbi:hypothetical protein ANN_26745 [Periplaneta americana]|uniref:Uncharacterized protein n=1 Tax=Periplaneta americana TaxID=6978 RepID=A0ABQ8RZ32_PERAM|nr:hypothetical protein ANN_26745 [Periplaneta americana]